MNEILSDFFNGKTDLKTAEDKFIRMLNDTCTNPYTELTYYATKETLEKFKKVIPNSIKTHEIPDCIDKEGKFKDKIFVIPIQNEKPLKIIWEDGLYERL